MKGRAVAKAEPSQRQDRHEGRAVAKVELSRGRGRHEGRVAKARPDPFRKRLPEADPNWIRITCPGRPANSSGAINWLWQ